MSERTHTTLRKALPRVKLADATELLRFIRMVKTEEEIRRIRKSAQINEMAQVNALHIGKPGCSSGDMLRTFMLEVASEKAVFEHFIFSPDGVFPISAENYNLKGGDCVYFDTGCIRELYYSDTGTTFIVGKGRRDAIRTCELMWNSIEDSIDEIRPGALISSVVKNASEGLRQRGVKNGGAEMHGIGLETREYPLIGPSEYDRISDDVVSQDGDFPFEEGMVVNVESGKFDFGVGAYQIERTFLVGKHSASELTPKRAFPYITG